MADINMKVFLQFLGLLYVFVIVYSKEISETNDCTEKCTKSYAPHTYPNGSDNNACTRGCRLYVISDFIASDLLRHSDDKLNESTTTKSLCHSSCNEAYNETSSATNACKFGCDTQESVYLKETQKPEEDEFVILKPMMRIKEVFSRVVGMMRIIQVSITTYFRGENDEVIAIEEPVKTVVEVISPEEAKERQAPLLQQDQSLEDKDDEETDGLISSGATSIECLSRKVGVPPYLLIISLSSFVFFLLYMLFVICSSNDRKKVAARSAVPIPTHALPVKLIRPEDLTKLSLMDEEEGQAPALPTKMKLPDADL